MFGIFRLADQLIDGFAGKQLIGQVGSPVIAEGPGGWVEAFWGSLHGGQRRGTQDEGYPEPGNETGPPPTGVRPGILAMTPAA
ncbi:MAG: hypothetical protein JST28_04815 [Acidobacteria bacterium]|nr:hypothetical protein [Acidobacteriota bacterium]